MKPHPSGRPIHENPARKLLSIQRIPHVGTLTPRLNREYSQTRAIGFVVPGERTSETPQDKRHGRN